MVKDGPIILVDIDNTLVDLTSKVLQEYNRLTNESASSEEIVDYNFHNCVKQGHLIDKIINEKGLFIDLKPYPNALHYFEQIHNLGVNLILLTQPSRKADQAVIEKREWIKKHLPFFDLSNVIFAHHKELVVGDLFFDDNPKHLEGWVEFNNQGITCKIEHPYNKNTKTDYTFQAENAWENFYALVENLMANYW